MGRTTLNCVKSRSVVKIGRPWRMATAQMSPPPPRPPAGGFPERRTRSSPAPPRRPDDSRLHRRSPPAHTSNTSSPPPDEAPAHHRQHHQALAGGGAILGERPDDGDPRGNPVQRTVHPPARLQRDGIDVGRMGWIDGDGAALAVVRDTHRIRWRFPHEEADGPRRASTTGACGPGMQSE